MSSKQDKFVQEQKRETERLILAKADRAREIDEQKRQRDAELRRWH